MPAYGDPVCFRCKRTPDQIDEYISYAKAEGCTENQFVWEEEGTYNPRFNTFCCTECYVAIGMPSAPGGWKAPPQGEE